MAKVRPIGLKILVTLLVGGPSCKDRSEAVDPLAELSSPPSRSEVLEPYVTRMCACDGSPACVEEVSAAMKAAGLQSILLDAEVDQALAQQLIRLEGCSGSLAEAPRDVEAAETATFRVSQLATVAFGRWTLQQQEGTLPCPSTLADLSPFVDFPVDADPWGSSYVLRCGDTTEDFVFGVRSLGPDRTGETADDIRSWDL